MSALADGKRPTEVRWVLHTAAWAVIALLVSIRLHDTVLTFAASITAALSLLEFGVRLARRAAS